MTKDSSGIQVPRVSLAVLELLDFRDPPVLLALADNREAVVLKDQLELQVHLEPREILVSQDRRVLLANQDQLDLLGVQVGLVKQVSQDRLVHKEIVVLRARAVSLVVRDPRVLKDLLVQPEALERQAQMDHLVNLETRVQREQPDILEALVHLEMLAKQV